jgi:hypothetical protein
MTVTCFIRYQIDPEQREEFARYAAARRAECWVIVDPSSRSYPQTR